MRLVPVRRRCSAMVFGPVAAAINQGLGAVVQIEAARSRRTRPKKFLRLAEIETDGEPIEEEERQMIRGIIEMEDTTAREIMAPRIDIVAARRDRDHRRCAEADRRRGFSRIPLYDETIDNIVGIIYAKDLLRCLAGGSAARR